MGKQKVTPVELSDGKTYNFAPVGLTDAACDLFEKIAIGDMQPKLVREVMRESLEFGGHSAEEIDTAVKRASVDTWEAIIAAMMPGATKKADGGQAGSQ